MPPAVVLPYLGLGVGVAEGKRAAYLLSIAVRIAADDHLKDGSSIFNGARHRARDVGEQIQWKHSRSTRQPHRRTNADECLMR